MTTERDRYRRASLREQLAGEIGAFWGNRTLRAFALLVVGGLAILWLLTPKPVAPVELVSGDCVHLRLPGSTDIASGVPQAATTTRELTMVVSAERASCDLSHSHEVSTTVALAGPDAYPGWAALAEAGGGGCDAAFGAFVGRPLDESRYGTTLWVPTADAWAAGERDGICLIFNKDATYLDHRARSSGE